MQLTVSPTPSQSLPEKVLLGEIVANPAKGSGGGFMRSRPATGFAIAVFNLLLIVAIAVDLFDFNDLSRMAQRWWDTGSPYITVAETEPVLRAGAVRRKPTVPSAKNGALLTKNITGWNPFGTRVVTKPKVATVPTNAPETRLNLTLKGIIHTDGSGVSARALIHGPALPERAFRVNDRLSGNVRVAAIQPDRVLLNRNGRFETLRLPKKESGLKAHRDHVTGAALRGLRDEILKRPDRVLAKVTVKPHQRQGRFVGFQVASGRESGLLESFDLKPNDVITVVNDIRLDSPIKGMQALGSLANLSKLYLEVLRGSKTQTFTYYLD